MFESQKPASRPNHLRWTYQKIERGQSLNGWIAGPCVGVHVHFTSEGSKPCRERITDGKLQCRFCVAAIRVSWLGYVPLYDSTLKQIVVGIKETSAEHTNAIPLHSPIKARRGAAYRDPIVIREERNGMRMPPSDSRTCAADLRPWLLVLWSDPEITAHFGITPLTSGSAGDKQLSAPPMLEQPPAVVQAVAELRGARQEVSDKERELALALLRKNLKSIGTAHVEPEPVPDARLLPQLSAKRKPSGKRKATD